MEEKIIDEESEVSDVSTACTDFAITRNEDVLKLKYKLVFEKNVLEPNSISLSANLYEYLMRVNPYEGRFIKHGLEFLQLFEMSVPGSNTHEPTYKKASIGVLPLLLEGITDFTSTGVILNIVAMDKSWDLAKLDQGVAVKAETRSPSTIYTTTDPSTIYTTDFVQRSNVNSQDEELTEVTDFSKSCEADWSGVAFNLSIISNLIESNLSLVPMEKTLDETSCCVKKAHERGIFWKAKINLDDVLNRSSKIIEVSSHVDQAKLCGQDALNGSNQAIEVSTPLTVATVASRQNELRSNRITEGSTPRHTAAVRQLTGYSNSFEKKVELVSWSDFIKTVELRKNWIGIESLEGKKSKLETNMYDHDGSSSHGQHRHSRFINFDTMFEMSDILECERESESGSGELENGESRDSMQSLMKSQEISLEGIVKHFWNIVNGIVEKIIGGENVDTSKSDDEVRKSWGSIEFQWIENGVQSEQLHD